MLTDFNAEGNPIFAVVAGVALAFFAMTGFENAANVAEETINPSKTFPRALIGGMVVAGIIYVLVSMSAALVVPVATLAEAPAALLEVIKAGVLPIDGRGHGDHLRADRDDRHHQHHAGRRGHPVPDPLRHGAGEHLPEDVHASSTPSGAARGWR